MQVIISRTAHGKAHLFVACCLLRLQRLALVNANTALPTITTHTQAAALSKPNNNH